MAYMEVAPQKQILFIHQNFPGQYRYLSTHFSNLPDWSVYAIGEKKNLFKNFSAQPPNMQLFGYEVPDKKPQGISPRLNKFATHVHKADALAALCLRQKEQGLDPDVILVHPGWGEGLYLQELFPKAKIISYFEFFYSTTENNIFFDPEMNASFSHQLTFRMLNFESLMALQNSDVGVCPTTWQASTFPEAQRQMIKVIHDGVDTQIVKPQTKVNLEYISLNKVKSSFTKDDEIITFSVRNLEPSRGFHRFMRLLPKMQALRPNAKIIIIGGEEVSYTFPHASGKTWKQLMIEEVQVQADWSCVFFLGKIPYQNLLEIFSITSLHLYWTVPFVLSWSMLEAMACEAPILASRTPPVEEFIEEGDNGYMFDFFSDEEFLERFEMLMADDALRAKLGKQARQFIVENYDLHSVCLPKHVELIEQLYSAKIS